MGFTFVLFVSFYLRSFSEGMCTYTTYLDIFTIEKHLYDLTIWIGEEMKKLYIRDVQHLFII